MTALAARLRAAGRDVIQLTVGEPDWDTDERAKRAAYDAIRDGQTKYQPSAGLPELRRALADRANAELFSGLRGTAGRAASSRRIDFEYKPENVVVGAGAKFVLYAALQALCDPGERVLVPVPSWGSYRAMIELAQGLAVPVPTRPENGFKLAADELRAALRSGARAIVFNSPNNPTGATYALDEWASLAAVLRESEDVAIVCDDVYHRFVFDASGPAPHLLQAAPDLAPRTVVVNAASKTMAMTGWRVGWALAPGDLIEAMSRFIGQSLTCVPGFSQRAVLEALTIGDQALNERVHGELASRRETAWREFQAVSGARVGKPEGALFLWVDVMDFLKRGSSDRPLRNSMEFALRLLEEEALAVVPGSEFGMEGYLRITYSVPEDRMREAARRFRSFVARLCSSGRQ